MAFTIRQFRRLPVCCSVIYQRGHDAGYGTVWNLSMSGWRFSGDLPLQIGEVCSLTVNLSTQQPVFIVAGVVRWVRGEEYGVESLVVDRESREEMENYIRQNI
jgi:hypothetical protein